MPKRNVTPRSSARLAEKRVCWHDPVQAGKLSRMELYGQDSYEAALARTELRRAETGEYNPGAVIWALHRMRRDEAKRK